MPPAHGNLHGAQAVMTRQVEQFRVESEALNPLLLEEDGAALPAKSFETALRIHEREPQDDSNDLVENDSGKLAKRRLMHADQTAIHGAGAMATSLVPRASMSLPASSMGAERSASVKSARRPRASCMPWRTLWPLPRFTPFETTRSEGILLRKDSATAAVRSFEPSSTTRISASRPQV